MAFMSYSFFQEEKQIITNDVPPNKVNINDNEKAENDEVEKEVTFEVRSIIKTIHLIHQHSVCRKR